ncbi:hypothetical protein K9B32_28890, partial [Rhizobium sp. 3T7]|uniref:hypothetical protein n=1 Tax=Rhizobium sp. 3T7 TaxID=2874922 RepID=UPI001CCAFD51
GDTASNTFTVNVVDDQPVIGEPESESVNEDDLPHGNDMGWPGKTVQHGHLNISWGADDNNGGIADRSVAFTSGLTAPEGLSSNGKPITYSFNEDHTELTAKSSDGRVVFTVTLSDQSSGGYVFTLKDNID